MAANTTGPTDSVLPQIVNLTPEEEAALDEMWEEIWAENEGGAASQQESEPSSQDEDSTK